jgi:spermidine synthase
MREPVDTRETPIENSPYRVVDRDGVRYLLAAHPEAFSAMRLDDPDAPVMQYQQVMLQWLAMTPQPKDVLLLGLGGGDMVRSMYKHLTQTRLVVAEIDPVILDIARLHFGVGVDDERLSVVVADGAVHVHANPQSCDVLMVDVCDAAGGYPDTMATEEFFAACRDAIRGDGPLVLNLLFTDAQALQTYCMALAKYFPCILGSVVSDDQQVVMAFKNVIDFDWALLAQRARELEPTFRIGLPAFWGIYEERAKAMLGSAP